MGTGTMWEKQRGQTPPKNAILNLEKNMSVKEKIYSELEKASDFISGQDLADACGVTRASVWKAIKSLQEEGANIEAVTNKGYKLITDNIFNQASIEKYLSTNSKIIFYETIDSTNTQAKRLLTETSAALLNKTVLIAAEQTAGRGRLGRSFYSPKQTGIYFSIIYSTLAGIDISVNFLLLQYSKAYLPISVTDSGILRHPIS